MPTERLRTARHAFLCLGLAALGAGARAQEFEVALDGKPIGTHRFVLGGTAQTRTVRSEASFTVKLLGLTVYRYRHEADERLQRHEHLRLPARNAAGGQRARAGAGHRLVDLVVDEVVIGAAGAAHRDGPDEEQEKLRDEARKIEGADGRRDIGRQRRRPEAGEQQQLPADRPVPAGELRIGPGRARQHTVDPVSGRRVGDTAGIGRRADHAP